ncbi:unnamed protein product [Linum trigynum]|uniref:Uncharacterized protein n=1 Tax=Linum trigynum TaxID=586398 RepID=A0AAV2G8L1_9ROSI
MMIDVGLGFLGIGLRFWGWRRGWRPEEEEASHFSSELAGAKAPNLKMSSPTIPLSFSPIPAAKQVDWLGLHRLQLPSTHQFATPAGMDANRNSRKQRRARMLL